MYLGSKQIKELIEKENLVTDYKDIDEQLQPDGFDLRVEKIEKFLSKGVIMQYSKILPKMEEVKPNDKNMWELPYGVYIMYVTETVKLPQSISGVSIQRSTVFRCGNSASVGAWDMGYNGKGCCLLTVSNPFGLDLEKRSRVVKLQFMQVTEGKLYNGNYQLENIEVNKTA